MSPRIAPLKNQRPRPFVPNFPFLWGLRVALGVLTAPCTSGCRCKGEVDHQGCKTPWGGGLGSLSVHRVCPSSWDPRRVEGRWSAAEKPWILTPSKNKAWLFRWKRPKTRCNFCSCFFVSRVWKAGRWLAHMRSGQGQGKRLSPGGPGLPTPVCSQDRRISQPQSGPSEGPP